MGVAVAAILLVGCASTASPTPARPGVSGPTTPANVAGSTDPAAARLAAAVQALSAGYTFDSAVKLNGTTVTEARGRWIGGDSEFVLASSGRSVSYRSVPPDAWVQQGDGSWVATQGPLPAGDPLAVFAAPLSVTTAGLPTGTSDAGAPGAVPSGGSGFPALDLATTYAPSALGLTGTDPIAVAIHLGADGSMSVTYAATTAAGPATSTTTITPTTDRTPIVAPG
ncbi:MAG: hypothetical protein ACHQZR_05380 [Candidatus Limnocylindrales bacterium]